MNKTVTVAVLVLLALGVSAFAYAFYLPGLSNNSPSSSLGSGGTGTMNIYLADPPPQNQTLKYLLINVTSITLKYSSNVTGASSTTTTASSSTGSSTTASSTSASSSTTSSGSGSNRFVFNVPPSMGTNVNLTKLQGPGILLGSPKVPAGNVTGIILNITGARAFWTTGGSTQLKVVADGKLMINVHFTVQSTGTTNLTLDIVPGDIHVSPGQASVLRPVIMVTAVSGGPQGSQTVTTTETESETSSSSSSTSSASA